MSAVAGRGTFVSRRWLRGCGFACLIAVVAACSKEPELSILSSTMTLSINYYNSKEKYIISAEIENMGDDDVAFPTLYVQFKDTEGNKTYVRPVLLNTRDLDARERRLVYFEVEVIEENFDQIYICDVAS